MIAVIFEVILKPEHRDEYLSIAAELKYELEKIEGFISIERYESIYTNNKILSLSFWENEKAIKTWRNLEPHRKVQIKGRTIIFEDYRIRVAEVVRDYGMNQRNEAPDDNK